MDKQICGVYKITNSVNNKYYIGSSCDIKNRIRKHFELLKRNKHHSVYLQNAYNKYGRNSFTYEILELCEKNNSLIIEQRYLDNIPNWKNVYNMSKITTGSDYDLLEHPNRDNIIKKMCLGNTGKHTKPFYIDVVRYEKLQDAASVFNVDIKTISNRIKNWKIKNYYYENKLKLGEYDKNSFPCYHNKPVYVKIKYYCNCGVEITKDGEFCCACRKIRRDRMKYDNPVIINGIEYDTAKEASRLLNVEYCTLLWRIKSNTITFKNYCYKNSPKDITKLITADDIRRRISTKHMGNSGSKNKN